MHTRQEAGLFDICHMGEFFLIGSSAAGDTAKLVTCRTEDMSAGKCRYGFMLNNKGGIIDDLIVFKISDTEFMLVVNAGTIDKDMSWIKKNISSSTDFYNRSDDMAKLDLQGPLSDDVMGRLVDSRIVQELKRFTFTETEIKGVRVILSRTGYTGERGFELFFRKDFAEKIWNELANDISVKPVGLGARDTLRLEAGYSLYGRDIDEERTPLEAGLGRFVDFEKDFIGREALLKQKEQGIDRLLTGFVSEGRRSARSHFAVMSGENNVGEVTSGAFSPCLKKGIGLCYIDKTSAAPGTEIVLTDGRVEIKAEIKNPPFIKGL